MDEIDTEERIWTAGDRLYKFAHEYYGDSTYWWIIAWFNERPTDSHFFPGDPIIIPTSLETMLSLFGERE
jgi:nucleoid-associated protein YgaU